MRTFLPTTATLLVVVAVAAVCSVSPTTTTATALAPMATTAVRPQQLVVGGWKKINVGSARIQELGSWAVAQHVSMAHDGLKFAKVTGGDEQVVAGMNYRLIILAIDDNGEIGTYGASIHVDALTQARKLISFVPAN
ncbi:hypothetical protein GUJ93_ZPchr0003g16561 [Zizania palustris]|uniref:Cystatin domain-containing protein n=1 Tax=Zizania palustris TaxID=103762 RepID=A0A8J5SW75_ZIZPA|nr:hypothetical protein GUJ93_ZPchr0003g16561 [Zizania palustris]